MTKKYENDFSVVVVVVVRWEKAEYVQMYVFNMYLWTFLNDFPFVFISPELGITPWLLK